jgi:hypothetical protein
VIEKVEEHYEKNMVERSSSIPNLSTQFYGFKW